MRVRRHRHSSYLRDETGGRRFWPVVCGQIDVDALAGARDQLWAEAKVRFESGSVWWLDTPDLVRLASDQQEARYEGDPWEEVVGPWLENKESTREHFHLSFRYRHSSRLP